MKLEVRAVMCKDDRVAKLFLSGCMLALSPVVLAQVGTAGRLHDRIYAQRPQVVLLQESVRLPGATHAVSVERHPERTLLATATVVVQLRADVAIPPDTQVQVETEKSTVPAEFVAGVSPSVLLRDATTLQLTLVPGKVFGAAARGPMRVRLLLPPHPPRATAEHEPPLQLHIGEDGTETMTPSNASPSPRMPSDWVDLGTLLPATALHRPSR